MVSGAVEPPRRQLGQVERRGDRHRHADHQRDDRGDQRADDERPRLVDVLRDVPVVLEREAEDAELARRPGAPSTARKMKKKTISARISAASPVSTQRNTGSARRAARDRSSSERSRCASSAALAPMVLVS